jgi:cytidylate kinase
MIRIITISREFGAGGSDLAALLGPRLGWPVLDQDIVPRVAGKLRLDDRTVQLFDEHPPTLRARISAALTIPQPDINVLQPTGEAPSHDAIAAATRTVVDEAAATPPLIVVGHGAQCILCARPDAVHVRLVAPLNIRVARVASRLGIDAAKAEAMAQRADADRRAWIQRYFHRDLDDDALYHLRINTGCVAIEEALALVAGLVESRNRA